ncbi:MAG: hypothetical protein Q8Q09_03990 [Deltaproteobacteria bacterium]|nr:hypothetical protein [Deltaproteobacteria bacterium]
MTPKLLTAVRDDTPTRVVRVVSERALVYAHGAQPMLDLPAHVRAGSALARTARWLIIVQDDTQSLGRYDLESGRLTALALPAGHNGARQFGEARGNKKHKRDFESAVFLPDLMGGTMLAFGSGSTPARRTVLVAQGLDSAPSIRECDATPLYEAFARAQGFCTSELNVEGVAHVGDSLWFFQRSNGQALGSETPRDAVCEVPLAQVLGALDGDPREILPVNVRQIVLGELDGVRLGITDAWSDDRGRVYFLAAAEDSPDAYHDGEIKGSALGCIEPDERVWWVALTDRSTGELLPIKAEGLVGTGPGAKTFSMVTDPDDPAIACTLYELVLEGEN